ncbi:MAG: DegQ family serine endoprotease [Mesorhizobium sp.]|uniref:DegQ family serine endoprotease n=1 Tax=Mesorhizobium sp. TaxID=1871066 RepID=UPI0012074331|nr:DegQ family serine endoprotease [Mesorhizobium sp.]TJV76268.1 MAG: DegQ family serine endoprotease [Mesorhizobium sp.]
MISDTLLRAARRRFFAGATAFVVGIVAVPSFVTPTIASDAPPSVADLAERLLGAVVNISTSQTVKGTEGPGAVPMPQLPEGSPFQDFFDDFFKNRGGDKGGGQKVQSLGSGFVIDAEQGIVVTNNHVIADADDIEVNFSDGVTLKATLVGTDTKTDVALLKVDPKGHKLTAVKFGDSTKMRVGDWVMAIGNPFGIGTTVTAGIVSARGRDLHSGPFDDFIQIDAPINHGNSGGPLVDVKGDVVGINTAIYSPNGGSVGVGFAIPSDQAQKVVDKLMKGGDIEYGYLGVQIQPVTQDVASAIGLDHPGGALVAAVTDGSPAAKAGIETGDVITGFAGQEIKDPKDLSRAVADVSPGSKETLSVWRNGKAMQISADVGRNAEDQKTASNDEGGKPSAEQGLRVPSLGLGLTDLTPDIREQLNLADNQRGAVVERVNPDKAASAAGIEPGDVIVAVDRTPVKNARQANQAIAEAGKSGRKSVLLLVDRGDAQIFVAVPFAAG